jgi:hypothetical protein
LSGRQVVPKAKYKFAVFSSHTRPPKRFHLFTISCPPTTKKKFIEVSLL